MAEEFVYNEISELQCVLLDMLKWFHDFCAKHDLRYYAVGGTMLGVARHQGFIPWDDDVDVAMPRRDYERLAELMAKGGRYALETPESKAVDFVYPFSKLYDTSSTLVEDNRWKTKRGVCLDIFPLDGFGDSRNESVARAKSIMVRKRLLTLCTLSLRKGRSWYRNLVVATARLVPAICVKRLITSIDNTAKTGSFDDCAFVGFLTGAWGLKEIMQREWFGEPELYQFENLKIYGVAKPDLYLTSLYGDWRQLPPEEKRVSHHAYISLDLSKSYLSTGSDDYREGGL